MNILYGKIGRAILFDQTKWSGIGGDNEAPVLLLKMAQMHPDDKFYIVQCSDFSKWDGRVKYPNIIPLMDGFDITYDDHTYLINKIKRLGIKPDYCIMYNGITSTNNIKGIYYKNRNKEMAYTKTLQFSDRYCANIVWMLNQLPEMKWLLIIPDPRYVPLQAVDISNRPEIALTQYNGEFRWRYREYETAINHDTQVPMKYAATENVVLLNKRRPPKEMYVKKHRKHMINMVLNQGCNSSGGMDRLPILKEWVLDNFSDQEGEIAVYGRWPEECFADPRFKGEMRIEKLSKLMFDTRYTLVVPTDTNWATAKFPEMAYYGIIPFMHYTYDTQKNIKCPDFLRVSTAAEFRKKVLFLEAHPEAREKLLSEMWELYGDDVYSGKALIEDEIYKYINNRNHE